MTLIDEMQALRDNLAEIPKRLGVPQYRDILIRQGRNERVNERMVPEYDYTLITPTPHIADPPPSRSGLLIGGESTQGILITQDDFHVSGVSRANYTKAFFTTEVIDYWVDPVLDANQQPILQNDSPQGIRCRLIDVNDRDPVTWALTLRKFTEQ